MIFLIILSLFQPSPIKKVKKLPGYSVIDYSTVKWSDGRVEKYDWHIHKLK